MKSLILLMFVMTACGAPPASELREVDTEAAAEPNTEAAAEPNTEAAAESCDHLKVDMPLAGDVILWYVNAGAWAARKACEATTPCE